MRIACPNCNGDEIEGGNIDIDGEWALQTSDCLACDCRWVDHYRLHHRTDYETGTEIQGPESEPLG